MEKIIKSWKFYEHQTSAFVPYVNSFLFWFAGMINSYNGQRVDR